VAGDTDWSKNGHRKVAQIEQPCVDAPALLQVLQDLFTRFFRKPSLSGAPDND